MAKGSRGGKRAVQAKGSSSTTSPSIVKYDSYGDHIYEKIGNKEYLDGYELKFTYKNVPKGWKNFGYLSNDDSVAIFQKGDLFVRDSNGKIKRTPDGKIMYNDKYERAYVKMPGFDRKFKYDKPIYSETPPKRKYANEKNKKWFKNGIE